MDNRDLTNRLTMFSITVFVSFYVMCCYEITHNYSNLPWLTEQYLKTQIELNYLQIDKLKKEQIK